MRGGIVVAVGVFLGAAPGALATGLELDTWRHEVTTTGKVESLGIRMETTQRARTGETSTSAHFDADVVYSYGGGLYHTKVSSGSSLLPDVANADHRVGDEVTVRFDSRTPSHASTGHPLLGLVVPLLVLFGFGAVGGAVASALFGGSARPRRSWEEVGDDLPAL